MLKVGDLVKSRYNDALLIVVSVDHQVVDRLSLATVVNPLNERHHCYLATDLIPIGEAHESR